MRGRRWLRSLNGRIVLVTLGVALIAMLVTAVLSLQLVRTAETNRARAQLKSVTATLSREPVATIEALVRRDRLLGARGERFSLVRADGSLLGRAAALTSFVTDRLLAGHAVSDTIDIGGESVVVEGQPLVGGGGVVGIQRVADINAASGAVLRPLLLALGVGLAAAIVAGLLLARWIAHPLVQTAAVARRLADGERGVSVAPQHIAEVEDVTRALTTLDTALTTSEKRQREFLLSVSHELRTPLTAIRGYAEALADGLIPDGDTAGVGTVLAAETERMDRFVSDLLELARLQADDFRIDPQQCDLNRIVEAAVSAWTGRGAGLGVELQTHLGAAVLLVTTDAMRVRQVVDGLIENALRVTPAGGIVAVQAGHERDVAVLEVRDSGPGLTEADFEVAFDRGELSTRYRGARPVGTGLGLSIAHRLVTRLGGTIAARSAPEGGACFRVTLPAGPT